MSSGSNQYELNLTPYIDLMSTLVVFLLMTAVWTQISVLSTDSASTTAGEEVSPAAKISLAVTIWPTYTEMVENKTFTRVAHVNGKVDITGMTNLLKIWKEKYPSKTDVTLNTENTVTYKMLISTFDTLVGNDFPDVGVSTQ